MIKAITDQNASPLAIYINKNDVSKFPERLRSNIKLVSLADENYGLNDMPKSYRIFLATELKATEISEVVCIFEIGEFDEIWDWEDAGLKFEATKVYPDDELSRILKDCDILLGHVEIGNIKFD